MRGLNTDGGYVQARCASGLVSVSASPALGWRLDEKSAGGVTEAEVRFESLSPEGTQVRVTASCSGDTPAFLVRTEQPKGDGGGGGGNGDGNGGGGTGGN